MTEEQKTQRAEDVAYKCMRCGYVLYKGKDEEPPEYCPQCAITHLKGDMVKVGHV